MTREELEIRITQLIDERVDLIKELKTVRETQETESVKLINNRLNEIDDEVHNLVEQGNKGKSRYRE